MHCSCKLRSGKRCDYGVWSYLEHAIFIYDPLAIFWVEKEKTRMVPPSAFQHLHRSSRAQMMFPAQKVLERAGEALDISRFGAI